MSSDSSRRLWSRKLSVNFDSAPHRVTGWHADRELGASFGAAAVAYAEHRPDYALAAVGWAFEPAPGRRVLDLGAGTGKLTATLLALGVEVVAVEPDPAMRAELRRALPTVRALSGSAEAIPLSDACVDAVLAGNAMPWFDMDVAGPEIFRVLTPGGVLAGLWNLLDDQVDWVADLAHVGGRAAIGPRDTPASWRVETAELHLPSGGAAARFRLAGAGRVPTRTAPDRRLPRRDARDAGRGCWSCPNRNARPPSVGFALFLASRPETAHGEFTLPMLTGVLRTRRL